jgi:hypothetical protein
MKLRTINEDTPVEYLAESMTKLNALLAEGKLRGFSRPFIAKGLVVFDRTGKLVAEVSTYEVAKQVAKALNGFITEDKNLLEGRFVKGPGGVPLDRRGNPKTPKQSAVAKQAATPSPAAKQTLTLDMVWRKVEDVVGQVFPDGDPHDWLIPWFKQYGITGYKMGDMLDQAAEKNGYRDVYDYYESMKDLYEDKSVVEGVEQSTDEILEKLTAAYRVCVKNRDSYANFRTIQMAYELLRDPLMNGDMKGYEKTHAYVSGRYPDAFDLLMDELPQKGVAEGNRFDEPLTGYHIVFKNSGNPVLNTPSFETKDQAQKYLMTKMFANHQDFKVVHTTNVGVTEAIKGWKHALSDMMKHREESGKDVHLVSLKKDGAESKMHDAKKSFRSEGEAREHHERVKKLNPNRNIAHNLYVGGKVEKLS